jgi:glycosyltransferase involved in cell wall biosynthesis
MPRVSILLTCYNHLRFLPAALDGVRTQTFSDFEILALDDGSTDGTREWLTEQAKTEPRMRLIFNEKNLGTYATLNVGLAEAKGEFIAILNDDDLWAPEKLARQVEMMDAIPKIGIVHVGGWFIDDDGNRHPDPAPLGFPYPRTRRGDILTDLIDHNQMITSSVLVRRAAFEQCGEFNTALFGSGDWEMWLRIARRWEVGYVDEPLAFYRVHGSNASHATGKIFRDDAVIREWITTWERDYEGKMTPELRRAFGHNWACLGTVRTILGNPKGGRQAYAQSIRLIPGRVKSYARWLLTFLPRRAR